jgi:hypothetical protein
MGTVNVDKLNAFLRGEISAVETYQMALDKVEAGSMARSTLEENRRSHEDRARLLREEIVALGGEPSTSSGAWGVWAKAIEGGAKIVGEKAAIAALEEGEDHGLKEYRVDDKDLDASVRQIVTSKLLPQQQQTHQRMSNLKKQLQS